MFEIDSTGTVPYRNVPYINLFLPNGIYILFFWHIYKKVNTFM